MKELEGIASLIKSVACQRKQSGELTDCTTMAHTRNRIGWQNPGVSEEETASCHHK